MSSATPKKVGQQRVGHIYVSDDHIVVATAPDGSTREVFKGPMPDFSRWHTIYPAYIDATRTVKQGRRVAKARCLPAPNVLEIFFACKELKIPCATELGSYPRSWWDQEPAHAEPGNGLGRVRVQIRDDDGKPRTTPESVEPRLNSDEPITNRLTLLKMICALLPEVRERHGLHLREDPNVALLGTPKTKKNELVEATRGGGAEGKSGSAKKKKKKKKGKKNR